MLKVSGDLGGANNMLRNRVYTALILAGLTAATIFWAPFWLFALVFAVAACVGAYEWAALAGWASFRQRMLYVAGLVLLAMLATQQKALWPNFIGLVGVIWLLGFVSILVHPKVSAIYLNRWLVAVLGWMLMLCSWVCLLTLIQAENGKLWVLWLFMLTTATDVGAFFVGRSLGQRPLAKLVSPGKTREGAFGGICLALIICAGALYFSGVFGLYIAMAFTLVMSIISIFGDLFESLLKRVSGVKDSGSILPGHGGVLDRIDSIVAVLPFLVWSIT